METYPMTATYDYSSAAEIDYMRCHALNNRFPGSLSSRPYIDDTTFGDTLCGNGPLPPTPFAEEDTSHQGTTANRPGWPNQSSSDENSLFTPMGNFSGAGYEFPTANAAELQRPAYNNYDYDLPPPVSDNVSPGMDMGYAAVMSAAVSPVPPQTLKMPWSGTPPPSSGPSNKRSTPPSVKTENSAGPENPHSIRTETSQGGKRGGIQSRPSPPRITKPRAAPPSLPSSPASATSVQQNSHQCRPEESARKSHNLVEKQYRNRLNARFERLLNVLLAADQQQWAGSGTDDAAPDEKRMTKADVLELATRHIKTLKRENSCLRRESQECFRRIGVRDAAAAATMISPRRI
ncbi:hypothetical protein B0T26DRAFT_189873 [Lasiosphaeria miniovina]|uniref:BHLH domain-containing protein n=1 Tax=Lasiosphaeria miniovina TaxID=1954250 RepID=A0AA40ATD4_9PEZI|nr:uncharacterized protein B0T26DRAFT_189873 [Lasiosphaeria miniovina]KAK0721651.1 hypothetical protein B0T26DRAFT_189873 [Lasiosphaeria miniovina]